MTSDFQPLATDIATLESAATCDGYGEFLRASSMSMGLFRASPGYEDIQEPHAEDEVYVVSSGTAVLEVAGVRTPVGPGSIAFVPARVPHRFLDIRTELRVLVVFAPPRPEPQRPARTPRETRT